MISEFELLPEIESGGLGIVQKARHKQLGYYRAIKQIRAQGNDRNAREDFKHECEKLERLSDGQHPNIVHTYGGFQIEGERAYLEMDWIDGQTLEDYCPKGGFVPIDEVLRFVQNTASALAYCHQKGIIHNDLHSKNVMRRDSDGMYILLDFGLAMENGEVVRTSRLDMGCPEYMSPERAKIELLDIPSLKSASPDNLSKEMLNELRKATPQWDIYSFGCLIFKALTGEAPFYRRNKTDEEYKKVLNEHVQAEPNCRTRINEIRRAIFQKEKPGQDFSKEQCPNWLIEMVAKCLSKQATDRFPDAQDFLNKFQKFIDNGNWNLEEENTGLRGTIQKLEAEKIELTQELSRLRELRSPIRINIWWKWATTIVVCLALFSNVYAIINKVIPEHIIIISALSALALIAVCVYETIWPSRETNNLSDI